MPIIMIDVDDESETLYYYMHDALGSVVALLNNSGNVVQGYVYDPFGTPTVCTANGTDNTWLTADDTTGSTALDNPYMFTARRYDPEAALYYYRARMYNPATGRFLQPDPIGYADATNLYQYCLNNPVNFVDPMGLKVVGAVGTVRGAFGNSGSRTSGIIMDDSGNVGWVNETGVGGGTPAGSVSGGIRVSNADTIFDMAGTSGQVGGSFTPGCAEVIAAQDYGALDIGAGLGIPGAELHGEVTHGTVYKFFNIFDVYRTIKDFLSSKQCKQQDEPGLDDEDWDPVDNLQVYP